MDTKIYKKFVDKLRSIKPRDIVYPGSILVFFAIVGVLFFFSTGSISKNINKVFYTEDAGATEALNLERYRLTAKKLNIEVLIPKEGEAASPVVPTTETAVTKTAIDKKTIAIAVKNSTKKSGIATTLANALETAGFSKPTTGNESKVYATTTIFLADSASTFGPEIVGVVMKSYPSAISTTTKASDYTETTIVIGTK